MIELNQILNAESIKAMKKLPDNSVDSVVTDSPYGLGFMNKKWDTLTSKGLYDFVFQWSSECFRVLKPGGYILSFGGTRTYHRMTCAIEDAGFEIRDCIMWLYGSGFPKSLNVGKAIMKLKGDKGNVIGEETIDVGMQGGSMHSGRHSVREVREATDSEAIKWSGYGTALKPACEPITVARKPLSEKTVAENILKWGTGGINIDDCRISLNGENQPTGSGHLMYKNNTHQTEGQKLGRFPANIILDEESSRLLDEQTGSLKSGAMKKSYEYTNNGFSLGKPAGVTKQIHESNEGGASRFFYCAKSSKSERNNGCEEIDSKLRGRDTLSAGIDRRNGKTSSEKAYIENPVKNHRPTVKPISLMRYLVRLVTQKGGVCLDPFGGSGTTGIACVMEDINYILIEKEPEYAEIARARINAAVQNLQLKLTI